MFIPCRSYNLLGVACLPWDGVVGLGEGESGCSAPGLETAFAFAPSPENCVLEPWFKELKCQYSGLWLLTECVHAQLLSRVWLFVSPMDCSPPGSSVHGISQARILEWVAISFSTASSQPWDRTHISSISCIGRWILYHWVSREVWLPSTLPLNHLWGSHRAKHTRSILLPCRHGLELHFAALEPLIHAHVPEEALMADVHCPSLLWQPPCFKRWLCYKSGPRKRVAGIRDRIVTYTSATLSRRDLAIVWAILRLLLIDTVSRLNVSL